MILSSLSSDVFPPEFSVFSFSILKCICWVVRYVYGVEARGHAFGFDCNQKSTHYSLKKKILWSFVEFELNL